MRPDHPRERKLSGDPAGSAVARLPRVLLRPCGACLLLLPRHLPNGKASCLDLLLHRFELLGLLGLFPFAGRLGRHSPILPYCAKLLLMAATTRPQTATHDVTNQVPPMADRNLFTDHRALVEGVEREGAGWAT